MCPNRIKYWYVIALILTIVTTAAAGGDKPKLLIVSPQPGDSKILNADEANLPSSGHTNIVIATHGWFEREPWPCALALIIKEKVDANEWLCAWFDWRKKAKVLNPRDAAQYARDKGGPLLAEQILKLSKNPQHIHLIGHSAGSWAISEAAKILAKQTKANIHLTFLDAYVPLGWDANELGNISNEPNRVYWADHYLTQDITLNVTNRPLLHAHNVDIGEITPGLKDHKFPYYWYPATVLGKYAPKDKYAGKQLFYKSGDVNYGFACSLEAGENNWQQSLKLPLGNDPVKIEKPK